MKANLVTYAEVIMENLLRSLTLDQAIAYNKTAEKFIFCTDILDEFDLHRSDKRVNMIEDKFDQLLGVN